MFYAGQIGPPLLIEVPGQKSEGPPGILRVGLLNDTIYRSFHKRATPEYHRTGQQQQHIM